MPKHINLDPRDPFPAHVSDALNEFVGTQASPNFELRIRAADQTVLEVPAGVGNDQVALAIDGRWRYIAALISRGGVAGAARTMDVYAVAAENAYRAPVPPEVGQQDETVYTFDLRIVDAGAGAPAGFAVTRLIGRAHWDGDSFDWIEPLAGRYAGVRRRADGAISSSALAPDVIATAAGLTATRQPSGGFLLDFAADMATQAELDAAEAALDAHEALTTAAHGGIVAGNDPRLTDARVASDIPSAVLVSDVHMTGTYGNRPPASAALNGVRYWATDLQMEWQCIAAAWVLICAVPTKGPVLPAGPVHGQEHILVVGDEAGMNWHLRWDNSGASLGLRGWVPVGDAVWSSRADAYATPNSAQYPAVAPGPITPALKRGTYLVGIGAKVDRGQFISGFVAAKFGNRPINEALHSFSYNWGSQAGQDGAAPGMYTEVVGDMVDDGQIAWTHRLNAGAQQHTVYDRLLTVRPLRIGQPQIDLRF